MSRKNVIKKMSKFSLNSLLEHAQNYVLNKKKNDEKFDSTRKQSRVNCQDYGMSTLDVSNVSVGGII